MGSVSRNFCCVSSRYLLPSLGSGLRGVFFNPLGCSGGRRRKRRIQLRSLGPCFDIQYSQQSLKTVPTSQIRTLRHIHIRVIENHF